jgi:hypothetical protein
MSHSVVSASNDDADQLESKSWPDITRDLTASAGVDSKQLNTLTIAGTNLINGTSFLSGCTDRSETAQVGNALCAELYHLLTTFDANFGAIVINDYPLAEELAASNAEVLSIQEAIVTLKQLCAVSPVAPVNDDAALRLAQARKRRELTAELQAEIADLDRGPATRNGPDAADKLQQIQVLVSKHQLVEKQAMEDIEVTHLEKAAALQEDYAHAKQLHEAAVATVAAKEAALNRQRQLGALLNMYRTFSNLLAQKVKDKINKFPRLAVELGPRVIMVNNPEREIMDFMGTMSLPGMLHALWKQYRKPTTAEFSHAMVKLMNYRVGADATRTNPYSAVTAIEGEQLEWHKKGYTPMLSDDMLFSLALANSFEDNSRARSTAMKAATRACKEAAAKTLVSNGSAYPIFDTVKSAIKELQDLNNYKTATARPPAAAAASPAPASPSKKSGGYNSRFVMRKETETAAAAQALEEEFALMVLLTDTTPKFTGEVPRNKNYGVANTKGVVFPYVACSSQSAVCPKCYNPDPSAREKCGCRASNIMCTKCRMYGHRDTECHQAAKTGRGPTKSS